MQINKTILNKLLMENLLLRNNSEFILPVNLYDNDGKKYEFSTKAIFNNKGKLTTIDSIMFTAEEHITLDTIEVIFKELNISKSVNLRIPDTTNSRELGIGDTFHFSLELNEFFE